MATKSRIFFCDCRHGLLHHILQRPGDVWPTDSQGGVIALEDTASELFHRVLLDRMSGGEEVVEQAAGGIHVGATIDRKKLSCSGAMLSGVPTSMPSAVNLVKSPTGRVMPKSRSTAWPSGRRMMFSALTSR